MDKKITKFINLFTRIQIKVKKLRIIKFKYKVFVYYHHMDI